ncbi:cellulase family glycosylhydrolase [Phocaeicola coprocola]|uniref:cellulase family glycosylhydrolase n=1 Tax=Phocaeicola coprocola TaxID=310298 RepID=UPI0032BFD5EB
MKNVFIYFLGTLACLMSLFLGACSEDDSIGTPYLKISKEELVFGKHEGEALLYIQSNVAYEVSSDAADWCSVVQQVSTSEKTAKYLVHVTENPNTENRTAVIAIKGAEVNGTVKVVQTANDYLLVEQHEYTLPGEGGEFTVQMQTTGDCQIDINADWIQHVDTRAVETRTETFMVAQNATGEIRTATIVFTLDNLTESVTVTQEALSVPEADKTGMELDAPELMKNIKIGWNLGNSLEATGGETAWGNPATTLAMIDKIREMGFNAVRIPCAWDQYLSDETTYEIKSSWLSRVKEVVDYCMQNDLYAILNIHWDGGWLENDIPNGYSEEVNNKQKVLWTQIATYFRDYDEHLLFAGCNEPNVEDEDDMATLLKYEQTFVDAVRATGGKNVYRNLIVQGPSTDIDKTMQYMTSLPVDITPDRLSVEVHYYSSWQFCGMENDESWGKAFYFWGEENKKYATGTYEGRWDNICGEDYIKSQFQKLKEKFTDQGVPVIIGEFAAVRRTLPDQQAQEGHDLSRAAFDKCVVREANARGLVPFYWDRGDGVLDRKNLQVYDELEYNGLMEGIK